MKKTVLHAIHRSLGAKLVEFCGWEMPVRYASGILAEHLAVRRFAGLFDVSHMGQILIQGPEAENLLEYMSTNVISGKENGTATYTVWTTKQGGCVDDLLVYRRSNTSFFVVVNAGNREKALAHLNRVGKAFDVMIQDRYSNYGMLALQGPKADVVMKRFVRSAVELKPFHFDDFRWKENESLIVSRTGYTGEDGFEILLHNKHIADVWELLLKLGKDEGIEPIGLGARDTLRLEKGFALYGQELSMTISPTETIAAWAVKRSKPDFIGKERILELDEDPMKRNQYGVVMQGRGIARGGCAVFSNGREVGTVTSGTQSPTLSRAIAIVMVSGKLTADDTVEIQVRDHKVKAELVKLPFLKRSCKR